MSYFQMHIHAILAVRNTFPYAFFAGFHFSFYTILLTHPAVMILMHSTALSKCSRWGCGIWVVLQFASFPVISSAHGLCQQILMQNLLRVFCAHSWHLHSLSDGYVFCCSVSWAMWGNSHTLQWLSQCPAVFPLLPLLAVEFSVPLTWERCLLFLVDEELFYKS